jgi:hypothetical protein
MAVAARCVRCMAGPWRAVLKPLKPISRSESVRRCKLHVLGDGIFSSAKRFGRCSSHGPCQCRPM